jgi:hypothetical protein
MEPESSEAERSRLLTRALAANAAFSGTTGLALLLASETLGTWLGIPDTRILLVLGPALLAFAAGLTALARSDRPVRPLVLAATASDMAWVVASAVLLVGFPDLLTPAGNLAVAAVAVVVAALGSAQAVGLRRP